MIVYNGPFKKNKLSASLFRGAMAMFKQNTMIHTTIFCRSSSFLIVLRKSDLNLLSTYRPVTAMSRHTAIRITKVKKVGSFILRQQIKKS
jgi:hypothetical protein